MLAIEKFRKYLYSLVTLFGVILCCVGCVKTTDTTFITKSKSPYRFAYDTVFNTNVVIDAGVIFELGDSVTISFEGDVSMNGTEQERVVFKPINTQWKFLKFNKENSKLKLSYVSIYNGKVMVEKKSDVVLNNVSYSNSVEQFYWDGLLVMNEGGTFHADSITISSNSTGEGIVLNLLNEFSIRNSYFSNVNDSFEVLYCQNGVIDNCVFDSSAFDDAVDINGCNNIVVQNCSFDLITDCCIEVDYHEYFKSKSENIIIVNNEFTKSKIGISSKGGSEIIGGYNSFKSCRTSVKLSDFKSKVVNFNSFVIDEKKSGIADEIKKQFLVWNSSVSDVLLDGVGNCVLINRDSLYNECELKSTRLSSILGINKNVFGKQNKTLQFDISEIDNLKE